MIVHLYHCSLAVISDYLGAPGRNRPAGTGRSPAWPRRSDIRYLPPTTDFGDTSLEHALRLFQAIDLADLENSPVRLNWKYLERELGLSRTEIRGVLRRADARGLLSRLTIDYDYERWLRHSRDKGCVVAMTCVEEADLVRDGTERARAFCRAVTEMVDSIINSKQVLRHVFVVPNGHLAPRSGAGLPWEEALAVLETLPPALEREGFDAKLNSYGYTKIMSLAIHAHKLGYLLRVV